MSRVRVTSVLVVALAVGASWSLKADVKTDQKSRVEFAGALGKVVNFFGGKAAKEGVTSTVAVKGDRKSTTYEGRAQIIDLNEEKVYDLDLNKKSYKVTTFEEIRRKMEEDRKKAEEQARKDEERSKKNAGKNEQPQKEMEVDFDVKETGATKTINGFNTKQVVMTITVREKGKTLEQSGGIVLTNDMWMAPTIAAMKDIADFDMRYAQKLGPTMQGASAEQLAMALAQFPSMKDAMAKMRAEGGKLQGTPIQTTTTFDAVKSAEQMEQEKQSGSAEEEPSAQGSVGGMLGGFAKKMAKKKSESTEQPKARSTFMTVSNEVLKLTPEVAAADVAIPAGFQAK